MESKEIKVIQKIVRNEIRKVIQEELTEILKEGLKPEIERLNEGATTQKALLKKPKSENAQQAFNENVTRPKTKKPTFKKTGFADILNETEPLKEQRVPGSGYETVAAMTSMDAQGYGRASTPDKISDPETNKTLDVPEHVNKALTRDYSALMKAMKKKGK